MTVFVAFLDSHLASFLKRAFRMIEASLLAFERFRRFKGSNDFLENIETYNPPMLQTSKYIMKWFNLKIKVFCIL
jgi:hypothetical protein